MRWFLCFVLLLSACAEQHEGPELGDQDVRITFLHTSDIHARLLPYRMQVTYTDDHLGLKQENEPFGGVARIAHIIQRERARSGRVVYIDSGDVFQGAPIFNAFMGEAEFRAMSYLNPDAFAIGNHEFDTGLQNLIDKAQAHITFPFLAANYYFMPDNPLGDIAKPYTIVNVGGVKIALIGIGDFSSLSSITDIGNSLKMMAMNNEQVVHDYVAALRPLVDMVVLVSHAGLSEDQWLIANTSGVDLVFGGHLHIVLSPPKVVKNEEGEDVVLVHSGAFAKYVGRLDVVAGRADDGSMKVKSHDYTLFPVDSTVPEEPKMAQLMEEYRLKLNQMIDLTTVYGYSPKLLTKYGLDGGDSALGNLVSEAIRRYARVDIGFTNTLGIRTNMYPGPITMDDMYNIFPFDNTITLMYMSGSDLRFMFDYVARRSSGRGCVSQLQISGTEFVMNCNPDPPTYYFECNECGHEDTDGNWVETDWDGCLKNCQGPCQETYSKCLEPCKNNGDCIAACNEPFKACSKQCIEGGFKQCILSRAESAEDSRCLADCLPVGSEDFDFDGMWTCLKDCFPRAQDIWLTDCPDPLLVEDTSECERRPLVDEQIYEVATNDYVAAGGSGFFMLKSNNTQVNTGLPLRDAVLEVILTSEECLQYCYDRDGVLDLQTCSVFQGCLDKVSSFYGTFCDRINQTGGRNMQGELWGCAIDSAACTRETDCYYPEFDCGGGTCAACKSSAQCMAVDPNSLCVDGLCMPRTMGCVAGRCKRICSSSDDCIGKHAAGEELCVDGFCEPAPSTSCMANRDCVDPFGVCFPSTAACTRDSDCAAGEGCRAGRCLPAITACQKDSDCAGGPCVFGRCGGAKVACTKDSDCGQDGACVNKICSKPCGVCTLDSQCPAGLTCSRGLCVTINATCMDNRCRTDCSKDTECKSGEFCDAGHCIPVQCDGSWTGEDLCLINSAWFAQEKCLSVSCVDSKVDGRIGRLLPDNLGELEFGFTPNNPEDIDEY